MKKFLYFLLPVLLLDNMGYAQDIPASSTAEVPSTVRPKRASKFQGLWQQRKGHNLRLDYGFQADLLGNSWVDKYTPIRFDLEYQYDIPWNPKRINFYAYAGIVYKLLDISYTNDMNRLYELCFKDEHNYGGYIGIGMKIHCTDWLHLSFAQAFNVIDRTINVTTPDMYNQSRRLTFFDGIFIGSQTSIRIVGQIKQWSIYLGYRVDRWQKKVTDHNPQPESIFPINDFYDNYLTFGIGYDF